MSKKRVAVVLFNLGGPDSLASVKPFLFNLFNDKAIIGAPQPIRWLLAKFISSRRNEEASGIYASLGGKSPLLENTEVQARALETALSGKFEARCFIAMRYWHPMTKATVREVRDWSPDQVVLLPLYPQFSTTTSGSSINAWDIAARDAGLKADTARVCCYPTDQGFAGAVADKLTSVITDMSDENPRILFSAHGLPKKIVDGGDPYQWQVEQTVAAIVEAAGGAVSDHVICYQSRVGPLEWIGPATDDEIKRAGSEGRAIIICPVAFVSENSETLFELDMEYRELADESGVPEFGRVPTVDAHDRFISGLANTVRKAIERQSPDILPSDGKRLCPMGHGRCPCRDGSSA